MDPTFRFTNEHQALRYVEEYMAQLARDYGKNEPGSNPQTRWAATRIVQTLGSLPGSLAARLSALEKRVIDWMLQALLRYILSPFSEREDAETDDLTHSTS
jgi:hypothetical protein